MKIKLKTMENYNYLFKTIEKYKTIVGTINPWRFLDSIYFWKYIYKKANTHFYQQCCLLPNVVDELQLG